MKPRRWFVNADLLQWKMMTALGDYSQPFFLFPYMDSGQELRRQGIISYGLVIGTGWMFGEWP